MEIICPKEICTGCSLCSAQCPVSCISMRPNRMGHLFPEIDQKRCIDCGLCQRKCPALTSINAQMPFKSYAAWANDIEEYRTSTSGGVAAVLSNYIVGKSGVVYGCAMFPDAIVKHVRIERNADLYKLKGSKYVQSDIREIIPLLKEDVKKGRLVLFIGTPCQVAAIKNIYVNVPNNLFLVDIICHGTPSLLSLQKHVKHKVKAGKCDSLSFRNGCDIIIAINADGREVYRTNLFKERFKDVYLNAFFDGFTYRDACYTCAYATPKRVSDLTIGDFWGVGAKAPADDIPPHEYGCSAILVNTHRGSSLLASVKESIELFERPVEECISGNEQLRHPKQQGPRIKAYRAMNKIVYAPWLYYVANFDHVLKFKLRKQKK